jgi:Na+/H+-dicarboxylate symporter
VGPQHPKSGNFQTIRNKHVKRLTGHLYFWVLIAILIGGTFGFLSPTDAVKLKPLGDGFNVDPATLDAKAVTSYAKSAGEQSSIDFVLHIIPKTFTDAFTGSGDLLQVLLVAVLFGYAMVHMGKSQKMVHLFIEEASHIFFAMMNAIMKLPPWASAVPWPSPSAHTAWPLWRPWHG